MKYPTDFAVIRLEGAAGPGDDGGWSGSAKEGGGRGATEVRRVIAAAAEVKDVHREQKFTRSLSWDASSRPENDVPPGTSSFGGRRARAGGGDRTGDKGAAPAADRGGLRFSDADDDPAAANREARRRRRRPLATHGGGGGAAPGRLRTRPTIGLEPPGWEAPGEGDHSGYHDNVGDDGPAPHANASHGSARRALLMSQRVVDHFNANALWSKGYTGSKVRMAVFDTGVRSDHPHFRRVRERTNWTHENTLNDGLGHGTFVAGVIASQDGQCPGFAPDAEIHAFRVFTNDQVSYTSWFLDAFNYAIATEMHVLNLSIGGPDYLDRPFVEKIWEITANKIIMVSAIGNDGPLYGTLNNPADQMDVIGVGGIDYHQNIASFSSRGMSTWELPGGYGRVKPDIVAYGRDVMGSRITGGCRSLSGTSVASPVVAGAVVLLASVVPENKRWDVLNPASMKQALVEGAKRIGWPMIYEQGAGVLDLEASHEILKRYTPRASLVPGSMDFTQCPYMWPHCKQALYHGAMPFMFNATIVNGMGLTGWLEAPPTWHSGGDRMASHLDVRFAFSEVLWPWSGYLAVYVRVKATGRGVSGRATGKVKFTVLSPPAKGETKLRRSVVEVPMTFQIIPTPPREKRILWSQYHSVRYPPGYIPRDNLDVKSDILDWHGDHPHTNFHGMYDALRERGYYLEILGSPLTCFDASEYGALMLVDSEEEYSNEEIEKLKADVTEKGLSVAVFGEWYHVPTMQGMRFFDDNTHSYWTPVTGGANVPALNDLLAPFGFALGDRILQGNANVAGQVLSVNSGANIARAPPNTYLHRANIGDRSGGRRGPAGEHVVAALHQVPGSGSGRVFVYGDSNCLDSSHMTVNCYPLLMSVLRVLTSNDRSTGLTVNLETQPYSNGESLPERRRDVDFAELSTTLGGRPGNEGSRACGPNSPLAFHDAKPSYTTAAWSEELAAKAATKPINRAEEQERAARKAEEATQGRAEQAAVERSDDRAPAHHGSKGGDAAAERESTLTPTAFFADDAAQAYETVGQGDVPVPTPGVYAAGSGGTPSVETIGVAAASSFPVLGMQDISFPEVDRRAAVGLACVGLAIMSMMLASVGMRRRGGGAGGRRGGAGAGQSKKKGGSGKRPSEMTSRLLRRQAM